MSRWYELVRHNAGTTTVVVVSEAIAPTWDDLTDEQRTAVRAHCGAICEALAAASEVAP